MPIAPLDWTQECPGGRSAVSAEGRWFLSTIDVSKLKFTPALPEGDDFLETFERYGAMQRDDAERRLLGHRVGLGNDDVVFAESLTEAEMLVEALRAGDSELAPIDDQLYDAGLTYNPSGPDAFWRKKIGSGHFTVIVQAKHDGTTTSVAVMYQGRGSNSWHNVAGAYRLDQSTFPASCKDPARIVVAHALKVMEMRLAAPQGGPSRPLRG